MAEPWLVYGADQSFFTRKLEGARRRGQIQGDEDPVHWWTFSGIRSEPTKSATRAIL